MPTRPEVKQIRLSSLTWPSPYQKCTFSPGRLEDVSELASSIALNGLLQPVLVRPKGKGYELVAGERRVRAVDSLAFKTITALVRPMTDAEAMAACATENAQREDLHPIDEADAFGQLVDAQGLDEAAGLLGLHRSTVAKAVRLRTLSESWREAIRENFPSWGRAHFLPIATLAEADQEALLRDGVHWMRDDATAAQVQRTADELVRKLDAAPWAKDDAELVPEVGACNACPLRASHAPGLFDDVGTEGAVPEGDRCLSANCWAMKLEAHIAATIERVETEEGGCLRLTKMWSHEKRPGWVHVGYGVKTSNKRKRKGWSVGVWMDGPEAGHVAWIKDPESKPREVQPPEGPEAKLQRGQERLERRRARHRIEAAYAAVRGHEKHPDYYVLLTMAAVLGTSERRDSQAWGMQPCGTYHVSAEGDPEHSLPKHLSSNAWEAILAASKSDSSVLSVMEDHLWHTQLVPVLQGRWAYHGAHTKVDVIWRECEWMLQVLGIDSTELEAAAIEALPEPKSWAKLRREIAHLEAKADEEGSVQ